MIRLGYGFGGRISQRFNALLTASGQSAPDQHLLLLIMLLLINLVEMGSGQVSPL